MNPALLDLLLMVKNLPSFRSLTPARPEDGNFSANGVSEVADQQSGGDSDYDGGTDSAKSRLQKRLPTLPNQ